MFLSHRQVNGGDLCQSIKLQLEVMYSGYNLRCFLDVDDLQNVHVLEVTLPYNVLLINVDRRKK